MLLALGVFTRPSFLPFAAVFAAGFLLALLASWRAGAQIPLISTAALSLTLGLALSTASFVFFDTLYYLRIFVHIAERSVAPIRGLSRALLSPLLLSNMSLSWDPVLAPLNNIRYNSDASNLAHHGLHPWWLHAAVNLPMLFGPLVIYLLFSLPSKFRGGVSFIQGLALAAIVVPMIALSLIPHQEPRFLVPLLGPMVVLAYAKGRHRGKAFESRLRTWRALFWIPWIVFNALAVVLLGWAHQGGVVPALLALGPSTNINLWHVYMGPRYLLGRPAHSTLRVTDFGGRPMDEVSKLLSIAAFDVREHNRTEPVMLIAPQYTEHLLTVRDGFNLHTRGCVFPHLNLDDAGDIVAWARRGSVGDRPVHWKELLSLCTWDVVPTD